MVVVQPPIFYGYKNQDPWIFKCWIFEAEQSTILCTSAFIKRQTKMWYAKTRVAGRALEY